MKRSQDLAKAIRCRSGRVRPGDQTSNDSMHKKISLELTKEILEHKWFQKLHEISHKCTFRSSRHTKQNAYGQNSSL